MGVPKFYRWVSERYPCLSEVVKEFQLPEFDNLYLDMNGIIHVCSHPDDDNPHFRITEEEIFKNICHYIDFLYRMIKPKKVFFMAVDGCAPRAKMNQQRGRRFRSAREAEHSIKKAEERGETLPTEQRFDSNCITPGTPFMVRLQTHLKYFVVDKISNDPLWQGRKIYLSGHETPGEGEHKVMDYIRYSKSQPDYDPDTRHCLYGLDADLIMLGLVSHEPRFSLLREEVRFGGHKDKNKKRPMTPEETTFHLLHLSLLRDYLAYEFSDLKGKLSFEWDMEKIIDDWILMGFLVGNDFIPHLPHLHIHHDALPLLWSTYKTVMPTLDGYLNESGHLNLQRFEKFMVELSKFDVETFESAFSDLSYLAGKIGGKSINESAGASGPSKPKMKELKPFKVKENGNPFAALEDLSQSGAVGDIQQEGTDDEEESEEVDGYEESSSDDEDYDTFEDEFQLHKRDYYMSKMAYTAVTPEVIKEQAQGYVTAIQWILLYYFEGCPSWSWFFAHHYAPYISDIRGFGDMKIRFDLSTPFLPFQQLMAVLPAASKELLPPALQPLMTEESSPVLDFYPVNFDTDLNGKQQDWEAVVLIPFIEETRLLQAMATKEHLMTKEEHARNKHGPHLLYEYSPENQGFYPSSLPGAFPDIHMNKAKLTTIDMSTFHIDANRLRKGILDGTRLDVYFPGFPTLRFLPHSFGLSKAGVKVFQHNSRGENMVLRIKAKEGLRLEEIADELLGKETYVGWPHLHEARVSAVADESYRIELLEEGGKKGKETAVSFNRRKLSDFETQVVVREADSIKQRQMDRFAIDVGKTEIIVYASAMTGRTYTYGQRGVIALSKQFASNETPFLYQMTVKDVVVEESAVTVLKTLEEVFPVGSPVFMLGSPHYGAEGKVKEALPDLGRIRVVLDVTEEPNFMHMAKKNCTTSDYLSNVVSAQQVGMDPYLMSRITGSIFVEMARKDGGHEGGQGGKKVNIGLNLKFTKRKEEVPGYTKYTDRGWVYSRKCIQQVGEYINSFSELWLKVQTLKDEKDIFSEDKLFPDGSSKSLKDVVEYLEKLPCTKAPRMAFGSQILDEEKVEEIERKTEALNPVPDIVKMKVKPRLLFRPLENQGSLVPDPDADFQLYDRVVVVKSGYSVPFGQRGTIIGIPSMEEEEQGPHSIYDVVFDKPFLGGIKLRCSANKGYRVPGSAMLNLTFGEFRKNVASSSSNVGSTPSGAYNNNNNVAGARGGQGLLGSSPSKPVAWQQQQQHHHPQQNQTVMWDSKGRPMFGKVFGMQSGKDVPQYVTPKVQGQTAVTPQRKLAQSNPKKIDNSEFDDLWKNLESHKNSKGGSKKGTGENADILKQAATSLPTTSSSQSAGPNLVVAHPPDNQASSRLLHHPIPQRLSQNIKTPPSPSSPTQSNSVVSGTVTPRQTAASDKHNDIPAAVQNLFASASKVRSRSSAQEKTNKKPEMDMLTNADDAEFLAMFNSLKINEAETLKGSKDKKAASSTANSKTAINSSRASNAAQGQDSRGQSQADLALMQLLKIGVATEDVSLNLNGANTEMKSSDSPKLSTVTSAAGGQSSPRPSVPHAQAAPSTSDSTSTPGYGRQVSLQELFDGANRHQKQQSSQPQSNVKVSKSAENTQPNDTRDPIAEVEAFCQSAFNKGEIQFDFKLPSKQNAYIATVTLPNGQRYEGSLCQSRQEAAKSAASIALLCLKTSQGNASHPVIMGYMSGSGVRGPPLMNRFFSPNSAFSPIGIPGHVGPHMVPRGALQVTRPQQPQTTPSAPPPPMLLTPQHFINQPPPVLPGTALHQLIQQQQMQNLHHSMPRPPLQGGHPIAPTHQPPPQPTASVTTKQVSETSLSTEAVSTPSLTSSSLQTGSTSVKQQFVPLQVTKQQKKKAKEDGHASLTSPTSSNLCPADSEASKDLHLRERAERGENITHVASAGRDCQDASAAYGNEKENKSLGTSNETVASSAVLDIPTATAPAQSETRADKTSDSAPVSQAGVSQGPISKPAPKSTQKKKSRLAANFGQKR